MKQIIILETNPADGGQNSIKCAFWFAVPAGKEVPRTDITQSAWDGASQADVDALRAGTVVEEVKFAGFAASATAADMKAALVKMYTDRASYLAAQPFKLQFHGVFFDSVTGWSV